MMTLLFPVIARVFIFYISNINSIQVRSQTDEMDELRDKMKVTKTHLQEARDWTAQHNIEFAKERERSRHAESELLEALDVERERLRVAKLRLSEFHFVGLSERFEDSLILLAYTLGIEIEGYIPYFGYNVYNRKIDPLVQKALEEQLQLPCTK